MEWELEWGPHVKALERQARKGRKIAALEKRPLIDDHLLQYWVAWQMLCTTRGRTAGFGASLLDPVSYVEIEAYCRLHGWHGEDAADLAFFVRILDMHVRAAHTKAS